MSTTTKPTVHEVHGTIKRITRLTNGSNQCVIVTDSNEEIVAYCSDKMLEFSLDAARYPIDQAHKRALSRAGNEVILGYEFNGKGTKYVDKNGVEQTRKEDSNSVRYMNVIELQIENIEAVTSQKLAIADAIGKYTAQMNAPKALSGLASLRRTVAEPQDEPETSTAVNDAATAALNAGKKEPVKA